MIAKSGSLDKAREGNAAPATQPARGNPIKHLLDYSTSPIGYQVFCSCGWSHFERKRNALARSARMKAAIRKHMEKEP